MGSLRADSRRKNFTWKIDIPTGKKGIRKQKELDTGVPIPKDKGPRVLEKARKEASRIGMELEKQFLASLTTAYKAHSNDTIAEYSVDYLARMYAKRKCIDGKTPSNDYYSGTKSHLNRHILPALGHIKLKDLSVSHVEHWIYEMIDECYDLLEAKQSGESNIKTFFKSIDKIYGTLGTMLSDAVYHEYIQRNVVSIGGRLFRDITKGLPEGEEIQIPSFDDVTTILSATKGSWIETPVVLMAYYGLRKSEALGLRWQNVTDTHILVRDTIVKISGFSSLFRENTTKNKYSKRDLPLNDYMREYLKQVKQTQQANKQRFGDAYNDTDFVCTSELGGSLLADSVTKKYQKLLAHTGITCTKRIELLRNAISCQLQTETRYSSLAGAWLGHTPQNVTESRYFDMGRTDP